MLIITCKELPKEHSRDCILLSTVEQKVAKGEDLRLHFIILSSGVTVGFVAVGCATVDEDDGLARFNLVKNGSSAIPVSVWFSTSNGTATGM